MTNRPTRHVCGIRRLLLVAALAIIGVIGLSGTASAHTDLASSDPAEGATLTSAPTLVTLTFDAAMVDLGATVVITGPDGQQYPTGVPVVDGADVRTEVAQLGPNGTYTIGYRVVSGDGHPVDGEIPFQLVVPAPPPATTPPPTSAATVPATPSSNSVPSPASSSSSSAAPTTAAITSTAASDSSGTSSWIWAGVVAAVLLVAGAAVVLVRRRRSGGAA